MHAFDLGMSFEELGELQGCRLLRAYSQGQCLHGTQQEPAIEGGGNRTSMFLRMAASESLRLHQPVPTLLRIALRDVTLSSGRKIAKDERVALFFVPANRETGVFGPDANEFNPYRVAPPPGRGIVVSRVAVSPLFVTQLIEALTDNWQKYAQKAMPQEVRDDPAEDS